MYQEISLGVALTVSLIAALFKVPGALIFAVIINFIALAPVLISAFRALKSKEISVDLLAVVALSFAFIAREWYSAAFINLMLTSARIFSKWTVRETETALKSLLKYKPTIVKIRKKDGYIEKKPSEVEIGDVMVVGIGERIAVDGIVVTGSSAMDESTITGESIPKSVAKGDHVYSSTLNTAGVLEIRAEKIERESTLYKIIMAVEEATLKKSKSIKKSSAVASWYIALTLIGAITIYLITKNVNFTLSILLVVCADDLAVSIPLAFTLAISKATKRGILIKSSDVLERVPEIKYIVTDKTGTLTKSKIEIENIVNFSEIPTDKLFSILGTLEVNSKHPVSREVVNYVRSKNTKISLPKDFKDYPGSGAEMKIGRDTYRVGKSSFIAENKIPVSERVSKISNGFEKNGSSVSYLSKNKEVIALVIFKDKIKTNIKGAIAETKRLGIKKWIMLTGDNNLVAKNVAIEAGIDEFHASVSPIQKVKFIEDLKKSTNEVVAMAGDGVNDAPALSLADVSIAMGSVGSDVAIEASDISIMNDNLGKIADSIILGKNVQKLVRQNIIIWVATNALGLALVLFKILGPTEAATYNFVTDFITTVNVFWRLNSKKA